MKIADEKLKSVCLLGQGDKTCAFVTCGADGFECAKGTFVESIIRRRLAEGTMRAQGDNCNEVDGGEAVETSR